MHTSYEQSPAARRQIKEDFFEAARAIRKGVAKILDINRRRNIRVRSLFRHLKLIQQTEQWSVSATFYTIQMLLWKGVTNSADARGDWTIGHASLHLAGDIATFLRHFYMSHTDESSLDKHHQMHVPRD
jgi:hypothetical protein